MNTLIALALILLAPTAVRSGDKITISDAEVAGVLPEAPVYTGVPLLPGFAWEESGEIVFTIENFRAAYEVTMFSEADAEGVRTYEVVSLLPERDDYIDAVVLDLIKTERAVQAANAAREDARAALAAMMQGQDPNLASAVSYFEFSSSVARVGNPED